jgi:hypothetical protein
VFGFNSIKPPLLYSNLPKATTSRLGTKKHHIGPIFGKILAQCGGFLSQKYEVVVNGRFEHKSGGFMILTHVSVLRKQY